MPINFHFHEISSISWDEHAVKNWILNIAVLEKFDTEQLNYIFCSDEYLHSINVEYLDHDTYTDIITFNLSDNIEVDTLEGDIYISLDRVRDNAQQLNISFQDELARVMVHGVLHLFGYDDHEEEDVKIMRAKENLYIENHPILPQSNTSA